MHTIFLGTSTTLDAPSMRDHFEIDPDHPDGVSRFEQLFGSGYIEPGKFEVYGAEEYAGFEFNTELFERLLPFNIPNDAAGIIELGGAMCCFYVESASVERLAADGIQLIGPLTIEKFDYE
ncbi:MAG: hypothetical protein AAGK00_04545 [Pseudomonadota bacterium]